MKEKKYRSKPGLENINVFNQFDQFETQYIPGSKNRFVFDLSNKTNKVYDTASSTTCLFNLSTSSDNTSGTVGLPGNIMQFVSTNNKNPFLTTTSNNQNPWTSFESIYSNPEKTVPYFEENAILFFDNGATYSPVSTPYTRSANQINYFRSGYFEISFKTNKSNCILASGTSEFSINKINNQSNLKNGATATGNTTLNRTLGSPVPNAIDYPYYEESNEYGKTTVNLDIKIKNGKLCLAYSDLFNTDNLNIELNGTENLADDQWHHVVVNFGRPGLIKDEESKFNSKFIEFWVDGKLDKRFNDVINNSHIFFPSIKYLLGNPANLYKSLLTNNNILNDFDTYGNFTSDLTEATYAGLNEWTENFTTGSIRSNFINIGLLNDSIVNTAFKGTIHTVAHGVNIPLDKHEISLRYSLWKYEIKSIIDPAIGTAEMVQPSVSGNKKRALKLFWNNLVDTGKDGIQLDETFVVDTISVTHKTKNSPSEIFNYDNTQTKSLTILPNVKVAFEDNVLIPGPGRVLLTNTPEGTSIAGTGIIQDNPKDLQNFDSVTALTNYKQTAGNIFVGPRKDLTFSGINLISGDRVLLTNQFNKDENGVWVFNGLDSYMTRPTDSDSYEKLNNSIVYVSDGYYAGTYWTLKENIESLKDSQSWISFDYNPKTHSSAYPIFTSRWEDSSGNQRFIDFEEDLDISKYDVIVFMNFPSTNNEIVENFPNESSISINTKYNNFIKSLQNVVAQGSSLYVSSPKLATDLGIVSRFVEVSQLKEETDAQSASINPFEINEDSGRYFDTHRNNKYNIATTVTGLTDKATYVLTDFISYVPENSYDYEQYHAKYSYRQLGLQEGNEFIIPGSNLRSVAENEKLPGIRNNQKGSKPMYAVNPSDKITGTTVAKFANTLYSGNTLVNNDYDDYINTIIVHNGQLLGTQPVTGKIFMNCVEDGYTFSRAEYNKARIQVVPSGTVGETNTTLGWQYSTTRLNRLPRKINISQLTEYGQTTPTNGGGGAFIQGSTNSSNGIIRSKTDKDNVNYQSDLYPKEEEEMYQTQEIPVLSMTWLGLQWLAE